MCSLKALAKVEASVIFAYKQSVHLQMISRFPNENQESDRFERFYFHVY